MSDNPASAFHTFVFANEFPLYFDGFDENPLTFMSDEIFPNNPPSLVSSSSNAIPDFFRFIPLDADDASTGYYLWSNGLYASSEYGVFGNSDCIPSTTSTTTAMVFKPIFLSPTKFKLSAPGYHFPNRPPGYPQRPTFSGRWSGRSPSVLIVNDGESGFQQVLKVPSAGRLFDQGEDQYERWHYFFSAVDFPLALVGSSYLHLSENSYLTAGGADGSTLFRFIPVNPNDYKQGYRIFCQGRYVAGMGVWASYMCLNTSPNIADAAVFRPKILSTLTFMLENTASLQQQVLTQPVDRNAILYGTAGSNSGFAGVYQVFQLPAWSVRILSMAYLSPSVDFSLHLMTVGKTLYSDSGALKLAAAVAQGESAVVSVVQQDPAAAHSGYLMTVGGSKYVRYLASDVPVQLVDDAAQATPLCIVRQDDGSLSFWHCMSNHVLTSTDGTNVIFTEHPDPAALEPAWKVVPPLYHPEHHFTPTAVQTTYLDNTVFVKAVVNKLSDDLYSQRGSMWNVSFDNVLSESDWLIATPDLHQVFGDYANLQMPVRDLSADNDFKLAPPDPSKPNDPKCVPLASSVKQPGDTPLRLYAGHSRQIYEEMYKVITSAERFVDVLGLIRKDATPSGQFLAAVRNAITFLSNKPSAQNVVVRILFGMPTGIYGATGGIPGAGRYQSADDVLRELVRDVSPSSSSKMKVYVAYSSADSAVMWNHAKIVAADGERALVGGHNMWDGAYLWGNPVLDVSMRLTGLAATDAHQFADYIWSERATRSWERWYYRGFVTKASFSMPGRNFSIDLAAVPKARLFAATSGDEAKHLGPRSAGSGTPVVSVARGQESRAGTAASDKAFIALIDSAAINIYMSVQAIKDHYLKYWPEEFLKALARALVRGVSVHVFMSDATNNGSYAGDPPADVIAQIRAKIQGKTPSEVSHLLTTLLTVKSFPPSSRWGQPPGTPGCSNHAKVMVVDATAVSIGSQNYYPTWPAQLAEFTYIFEDVRLAGELLHNYFVPMESWCTPPSPPPPPTPPPTPPPPPTPLPPPLPPTYTVTITELLCVIPSDSVWGQVDPDQTYLTLDGSRIWPTNSRYINMNAGDFTRITLALPSFTASGGGARVVSVWDYNFFEANAHLGDFRFDADLLRGKTPGDTYKLSGNMQSDKSGVYEINYTFTAT